MRLQPDNHFKKKTDLHVLFLSRKEEICRFEVLPNQGRLKILTDLLNNAALIKNSHGKESYKTQQAFERYMNRFRI